MFFGGVNRSLGTRGCDASHCVPFLTRVGEVAVCSGRSRMSARHEVRQHPVRLAGGGGSVVDGNCPPLSGPVQTDSSCAAGPVQRDASLSQREIPEIHSARESINQNNFRHQGSGLLGRGLLSRVSTILTEKIRERLGVRIADVESEIRLFHAVPNDVHRCGCVSVVSAEGVSSRSLRGDVKTGGATAPIREVGIGKRPQASRGGNPVAAKGQVLSASTRCLQAARPNTGLGL